MTVSIGPRIGVEGVKQFRQAFLEITAEAKRFDAEMKRITATFDANDSAMTRNRKMREQLTKQIEHQKGVVQAASDTYEEAVKAETKAAENYEKAQENAQKKIAELEQEKKKLTKTVEQETKEYKSQELQVKILQERYDKAKENLKYYSDTLGKSHPFVKQLTKELDEQGKELDEEKAKLKEQEQALNNATRAVRENEAEQRKVKATVEDASNTLYRASSRVDKYGTDVENAKTKLAEFREQLKNIPSSLETINGYVKDLGGTLAGIGDSMSKYITAPLVALGTYGVKNASNLTDGMAKIYTIATESQEPMESMKQGLIDLSDASGFALDDLTAAAYQAVSASVDAGDAVEFMGDATRLARAGFTTTEKSVDLLTTIMNAYGKETYTAAYLSDLLLRTQNDGKTIVDELASSMGVVIPTAAAYNVGIEQIAAAYATMTKQGVNTARATTMLNALFTELEKPDKDAAVLLEELTGKSFAQLMADGESLGDVLGILYNNLDRNSEAFANLFKNIRSGRAANALMSQDSAVLNYELERMADVTGQTDYALEMLETPSLKARKALNKLKNSTIDLGDTLIGALYPLFEKLTDVVDDFRDWVKGLTDEEKKNIASTLAWVAAVGPMLKVAGGLLTGIGGVVDQFIKMRKATEGAASFGKALTAIIDTEGLGFSALVPQIALVVAGITALTVVTGKLAKDSYDAYRSEITSANGLTQSERELIESKQALYDSTMQMNQQSREEAQTINDNSALATTLKDKYNDLVESTGLVTDSDKALADMYLEQLADALGMELEDVQALVDENGKLSASIDEVIQKKRASALLSAYEDDYAEALKNRSQAEKDVIQLTTQKKRTEDQLVKTQENLTYWTNRANEEAKTGNGISKETQAQLDKAVIAHSAANDAYERTATELDKANEKYQTIMSTIEGFEGTSTALATGSAYEIEAALMKMVDGFITAERGTKESLENQVKNARENFDKIKKAFDEGAEGVTQDTVDAYRQLYTDSQAELNKWVQMNGEQATKGMNTFDDNIRNKKEQTRKATQDATSVIPAETGKQLKAAVNTADTGMEGVISRLRSKVVSMTNAGKDLVGAIKAVFKDNKYYNEMFSAGSYFVQGFINGMKAVNVSRPSNQIMTTAVQASKSRLMEKSPSKVMEEVGEFFTLGFVQGINNENAAVRRSANAMSQSAVDSSWMTGNYTPTGYGFASSGMSSTRNITAPISVNVNVNGNVDNVDALADVIAERINDQIIRRDEVFA